MLNMTDATNLVDMAYVANAFGIQGWVKIKVGTEYADSLDGYPQLYLKLKDGSLRAVKVEKSFVRDSLYHAKFSGVNDRNSAEALKGAVVAVDRSNFPTPDEDEYYWVDLIGMQVKNLAGESIGTVEDLMETGAHDVLVVQGTAPESVLIPFVAQYVTQVELKTKTITVDWGLDY